MANNGIYYSSGNTLNFTTNNTTWATITSGGTFQMSAVSATTYYNLPPATFTGGTVSGATNFTGGLTANTISATTFYNLPVSAVTNGTGISASTSNGEVTITNIAPDQTVTISGGTGITTGGTYPNFTLVNSAPDQTVTITGGTNIQIVSNYPNFGVNFTGSTNGDYLPLSGGTVTGGTIFQSGLTANTISATTYQNLPQDVFVTGGTYTAGSATFTNTTGGTFSVTGFPIGGGGGQTFYLNLSQTQNGNRLLSTTASTASEQTSGVTINNGVTGTIASFQSQPLNITLLPGGIWSFYLHSYKENNNATFNIFVELYKRTSGGTQTLLFATDPSPVTTNSPNPSMQLTDGYFSGTTLSISDSVVAVVRATNTNNQSHTITLVTEGSTHYSYVVSTIPTQQGLTCDTLSGCSIIQTIQTNITNKFDKSGGTVTGATNFTNGLTANTISATTYQNLPQSVSGAGTTNYIPKWTGSTGLGDSQIFDNGGFVGISTTSQVYQEVLSVAGDGGIVNNAFNFVGHTSGSIAIADANYRTWASTGGEIAIGGGQPLLVSQGAGNIAIGYGTLSTNDSGAYNIAIGYSSLANNTTGINNIAIGDSSLLNNQAGEYNVSIGSQAGNNVTSGSSNVFIGNQSGYDVTTEENRLYISNSKTNNLIYGEFDNNKVGINTTSPITNLDVSGNTRIAGALTATTISATTYQNLPVSAVTSGTGISASTSNGTVIITNTSPDRTVVLTNGTGISATGTYPNFTITNTGVTSVTASDGISGNTTTGAISIVNTDKGSSQNIFKNILIGGVSQFSASSNSSNLNFSGTNISITSAATNTLVFSGNSGTVTSVALSTGTSGTDVNISNSAITTSGTITINVPDASTTARGVITTGTQTIAGNKTINGNLTITGTTNITGATTSSGDVTGFSLVSSQSSGDEGGEVRLAKAATNTTLSGTSITIDINQNRLRFFETGSPNRGAYIDLTTAFSGVGSNLLPSLRKTDSIETTAFTATAQTTVKSFFIPANTVGAGDIIVIMGRLRKSGTTSSLTARFYANTSTSPGGSLLGSYVMATAASTFLEWSRNLSIVSATNNTGVYANSTNAATSFNNSTLSTLTVNWTQDVYLLLTYSMTPTGDNVYGTFFDVEIRKYNP